MNKPNLNNIKADPKEVKKSFPLLSLVFLVFLVLKLAGIGAVATWSWWWVTAPLWGPFAIVLGILAGILVVWLFVVVIAAIVTFTSETYKNFKNRK